MKILFERTGGFSGIRVNVRIDTDSLPQDEANELLEMVRSSGYFNLPAVISPTSQISGADQFIYKITVEDEGREHTVQMTDGAVPDELQQLILKLVRIARGQSK